MKAVILSPSRAFHVHTYTYVYAVYDSGLQKCYINSEILAKTRYLPHIYVKKPKFLLNFCIKIAT